MFRAFKLKPCTFNNDYQKVGAIKGVMPSVIVEKALTQFLENGKIDGSKLRDHWFPEIQADVFISHSHQDQPDARILAGYLYKEYGLKSFIDSCVWGYAADLLKIIDNEHCRNPGKETYSYNKRNGSTSHVHMMLSTALGEMLDSTECAIFLDTPNSITSNDAVKRTKSPWIYYELGLMRLIRERQPNRPPYKKELLENFAKRAQASLEINYSVRLDNLIELDGDDLNKWWENCRGTGKSDHPLDVLYNVAANKT